MSKRSNEPGTAGEATEAPKSGKGPTRGEANALVEWTKSLFIAAILFLVLRSFLVQTFVITSGSMEDTLLVGDMLMVNRAAIGSRIPLAGLRIPGYSRPKRLDVIVFDPPHEENLKLVKRLIGLPGDTISMRDRTVYVNGVAQDEPYVKHSDIGDEAHPWMAWQRDHLAPGVNPRTYTPTRDNWGPLVIPPDRYLMLGDNRETSLDSRYWGLLEGWRLEGRAVFTYFSYNKESYRPFPWLREVRWGRLGQGIH
ncbi:MAG TPA: signal peptidase I [Longimicrobiales bacterium]|nr:signal peptidase I [Longimicrobiales bacterium]